MAQPVTEHRLLAAVWNTDPVIQATGAVSVDVTLTAGTVYQLVATKAIRFKQGTVGVVADATSNYLAEGACVTIAAITGLDHVAVIQHAAAGSAIFMHPTQAG